MRKTGHYEQVGNSAHFIPDPLPPKDPPLSLDAKVTALYGDAMLALGKLNEMAAHVPDIHRFIKAYVIKEALLSSSIEGIHTTLLEVFTQPLSGSKPNKDTQLVMNYTKALDNALFLMKKKGLPIVSRVICNAHEALMQLGEGDKADPGHFRKQSVRVGALIPPPAPHITSLMASLEQYMNTDESLPPLIKAGLAHVQFETIHPFLDGNGRIGRLLIILLLIENNLLSEPILYISYYFKKHQLAYYHALDRVRMQGDFEGWITFYLNAVKESSIDAYQRAQHIEKLNHTLSAAILNDKNRTAMHENRLSALKIIFSYPVISTVALSEHLNVSYNTADSIIDDFLKMKILVIERKQKRNTLYKFKKYLDILEHEYN